MQPNRIPTAGTFSDLAERQNSGWALCNSEGIITHVDEHLCNLSGHKPDFLLNKPIGHLLKTAIHDIKNEPRECKLSCVHEAGESAERQVLVTITTMTGPNGTALLYSIRLNETEQPLSHDKTFILKQLLLVMPDLLFTVNQAGLVTDFLETANDSFAIPCSEIIGYNIFNLLSISDQTRINEAITQCLDKKKQTTAEYTMQIGDDTLHFEARFVAFTSTEVLCVIRDITATYQANENRATMNRILELLVDITGRFMAAPYNLTKPVLTNAIALISNEMKPCGSILYQFDSDNFTLSRTIEWLQPGLASGIDSQEKIPASVFDEWMPTLAGGGSLTVNNIRSLPLAHPARIITECYGTEVITIVPVYDGRHCLGFWAFMFDHPLFGDSHPGQHLMRLFAGLSGSFLSRQKQQEDLDLNRRRLAIQNEELTKLNKLYQAQNESIKTAHLNMRVAKEMAEASDKLKSNFLNMVTHEIRTPLNGILGFAQLMSMPVITEDEKAEYLQILNSSTDRLINTVNNLLQVSLIISGNTTPNYARIDLNDFFRNLQKYALSQLQHKSIAIHLTLPEDQNRLTIRTDNKLLGQALEQLINNSVKYTKEGYIELGYQYDGSQIRMWVKDTGIGIAEKALNKVFEVFQQENDDLNRSYEGLGLGLSVAKGLVAVLGGQIELSSRKETGSTFTLRFPAAAIKPDKAGKETIPPVKAPAVIIADLDAESYTTLLLFLRNSGIETIVVSSTDEVIEHCKMSDHQILALVHTTLPGISIKNLSLEINHLQQKIYLYSVDDTEDQQRETATEHNSLDGHLVKPLSWIYIKSILKKHQF